jgi:DNA-binding response OmpR family regulator
LQRIMNTTATTTQRYECDVVLVEDFKDLADTMADVLRRSSLSVQVALDGRSALEIARHCVAKVALIDCQLPDIEGPDLVRALRALWPATDIILVSGNVGGISAATARDLGIRMFLNKPVPLRALCQAVHRLLREPRTAAAPSGQSWISLGIGSPNDNVVRMPLAPHR